MARRITMVVVFTIVIVVGEISTGRSVNDYIGNKDYCPIL